MSKIYDANEVARYFLAKQDADAGDTISNLKLQKLCYYAQGVALAARGQPLFDDPIEAWLHGPVVPSLYRQFRDLGSEAIPPVRDLDLAQFHPADRMILDDVYAHYGQYSAWRLRQMTHDEAPWKDAYEADMNHVITNDALKAHFGSDMDNDYRDKYAELSRREA